jgi:hypothetical protein
MIIFALLTIFNKRYINENDNNDYPFRWLVASMASGRMTGESLVGCCGKSAGELPDCAPCGPRL